MLRRTLGVFLFLILSVPLLEGRAMNSETENQNRQPPISPNDEKIVPADPALVEECRSALDKIQISQSWKLGKAVFTQSDEWGTLWRVDYTIQDEEDSSGINRIICWRTPGGKLNIIIAVGQAVEPLT